MKNYLLYFLPILFLAIIFSSGAMAEDYFWVGGQGAWSDLNSWRTVTGQIPNEVPDATDNVIFNENSFIAPFDTVFILTRNPTCKNFTVQNIQDTIVFYGGSGTTTFMVYGSWTMDEKARNEYTGRIKFTSGQLVFETTDASIGWNGEVNGVKQEMEVYTYHIRVVFQDKVEAEEKGNITLLR